MPPSSRHRKAASASLLTFALLLLAAAAALAAEPAIHADLRQGAVRVTVDEGDAGARRTLEHGGARVAGLRGEVSLVDTGGRVVRTLWRGTLDRPAFDVPFTARDRRGRPLPPGLYFVVLQAGAHRSISRVAVLH